MEKIRRPCVKVFFPRGIKKHSLDKNVQLAMEQAADIRIVHPSRVGKWNGEHKRSRPYHGAQRTGKRGILTK